MLPQNAAITSALGSPLQIPAATPQVGLKSGQGTAVISLETNKAEALYIVCAVAGHLQAGMWDRMTVSNSIKTPSISVGTPSKSIP